MTGFVYFLRCGDFVKVGYSALPNARLKTLQNATPYDCEVLAILPGTNSQELATHHALKSVHYRREWFRYGPEVLSIIQNGLPSADTVQEDHPLRKAIILCGRSQCDLANATGFSMSAVSVALRTGRVSPRFALAIERATKGIVSASSLTTVEVAA